MINSPVVRAENLKFQETGVRNLLKELLLPWYNSFRYLIQSIAFYTKNVKIKLNIKIKIRTMKVLNIMKLIYQQWKI